MNKLKPYLTIAVVTLIVVAIASHVGALRKLVFNAPASLEFVEKTYGFDPEEVSSLQPLRFVARNQDSQGELRGRIKL